jgi:hypothetical protein
LVRGRGRAEAFTEGKRSARRPDGKKKFFFTLFFAFREKKARGASEVKKKPAFSRPVANSPRFSRIALSDACRAPG